MQESIEEQEFNPDLVIRASSFSTMFDCSARWQAMYLLGMRSPSGGPAVIGTAVHRGTATFDTARLNNEVPSVEAAIATAADSARHPEQEVRWDDMRPGEAVDIAARLTMNYCNDIAHQFTYRKVEMKLNSFDINVEGVRIRFTGNVDRQYTVQQPDMVTAYGTLDFKTGAQVVRADGSVNVAVSAAQLGTYELLELMATETDLVPHILPAMIVAMPTAGKQTPKIKTINNPRSLLIGDEQNKGLIEIAAAIYKNDLFVGNPRSMLCNPKYCPAYDKCRWRLTGD